jgi:hypothetical protein
LRPEKRLTLVRPPSDIINSTLVPDVPSRRLESKPEKKLSMYALRTGVRYASAVEEVPRGTI